MRSLTHAAPPETPAEQTAEFTPIDRGAAQKPSAAEVALRQADGLRALAAMLEANPELSELFEYPLRRVLVPLHAEHPDPVTTLAKVARAAKACGAKITKDANDKYFNLTAIWPGVTFLAYIERELVCERVVTGTETVTTTVPDPALLAKVPTVEVTEVVELVTWRCPPLLAGDQAATTAAAAEQRQAVDGA